MRGIVSVQATANGAYDSITTLCEAARAQSIQTEAEDPIRSSTIELLSVIGGTRTSSAETLLVEMLDAKNLSIAMVAAEVLGKHGFDQAIKPLTKQIDRAEYQTHYGFRFHLVRTLATWKHPDAIEFITSLKYSLNGQLRIEIEKFIDQVQLADFRGDEKRFETWKAIHRPELLLASAESVDGYDSDSDGRRKRLTPTRQYYGIEIQAKRMMFLLDQSGSMKEIVEGRSRLDRAKSELIRVIEELPEDTEFAIAFFSNDVRPWRTELVQANDKNKQRAVLAIRYLQTLDKTNTYAALRQCLEFDDQLEAVFLLTDGSPTFGRIVLPHLIVEDILSRNRFRHLKINTIGIAANPPMRQFLQSLAEGTAGEFRQVE